MKQQFEILLLIILGIFIIYAQTKDNIPNLWYIDKGVAGTNENDIKVNNGFIIREDCLILINLDKNFIIFYYDGLKIKEDLDSLNNYKAPLDADIETYYVVKL